jgi:NAD(P)-dependent dehydrogenase (short-subunit alcohol dehydrogenase family)
MWTKRSPSIIDRVIGLSAPRYPCQRGSGFRLVRQLDRFTGSAERKAGLVAGVPLQRAGEPDEIANAIVFLASSKSLTG